MRGAFALLLLLAACRRGDSSGAAPGAAGSASVGASPAPAASAGLAPGPFAPLRDRLIAGARTLEPEASALLAAIEQQQPDLARAAYSSLRRRYRALEPAARLMAKLASSQIGAYAFLEPDEAGPTGLPALGALLRAGSIDFAAARPLARRVLAAARLLPGELESQDWTPTRVGLALSEGAFVFGARLDGSDSFDEAERWSDVDAELTGLLAAVADVVGPLGARDPEAVAAIRSEVAFLESFHMKARGASGPSIESFHTKARGASGPAEVGALAVLGSTGRLGAALRRAFGAAGSVPLSAPFAARHDGGKGALAPVSAVTFPVLRGEAPEAAEAALGRALFASKLLSRNRSVACASCHDERHAFARPDPPAQTFDRKVPPRNAPGLWNAAYETFFFWDGRASTMSSQIDVAVDRDMGGDWVEVERRLNGDEKLRALAGAPLTADRVRRSIVAFERTLIEDQTRLDRHVRGELTLSAPEQRGFDVFFGKARCTRCHRPPLLSSVQPPRFLRTELSAIGAPTRPDGRDLGADTGRHAITHHERDRAMFKAPGLRRVAETAPYFHHGGFATLAQVVSFYEKGGGPGLGIDVPNADPELRPFSLTAAERADLLVFLAQSLSRLETPWTWEPPPRHENPGPPRLPGSLPRKTPQATRRPRPGRKTSWTPATPARSSWYL